MEVSFFNKTRGIGALSVWLIGLTFAPLLIALIAIKSKNKWISCFDLYRNIDGYLRTPSYGQLDSLYFFKA